MTKPFPHSVRVIGVGTTLACVLALACGDDKGTSAPPVGTAGAGAPAPTAGTPAATGGTPAPGAAGTGTTTPRPAGSGGATPAPAGTGGGTPSTTAGTGATPAPTAGTGAPEPQPSGGSASVTQFHGNAKRDGHYVDAAFTRTAAAMLKKDATFMAATSGNMYAQPLYFDAGAGGKDLVIAATQTNQVSAFDAASGAMVWQKTLAMPATSGLACRGNVNPLGVTGTPVIDPATKTLYVAAMTSGPKHQIYALSLDDGSTKAGWPVDVSTVSAGSVRFNSAAQHQRGASIIVGDMLYVPYGGHFGDCGEYHGWVVGVPLSNPAAPVGFATTAYAGGIWAPGGLASDGTSVFAATGNTMAQPLTGFNFSSPSTWGHGNAVLRLPKDLKTIAESQTKDFFAVQNWQMLDTADLDLGGSGPLLFSVPGATPSELAIAMGKEGAAYLLDVANLGGMGGEIERKSIASGGISSGLMQAAAAYQTPTGTFVAFRSISAASGCTSGSGNLGVLKIDATSPPKMNMAWCAASGGTGSPIATTTDGKTDSIVWVLAGGKLLGFNGESGMPVYTGGGAMDGTGMLEKWQTPIVAKGRIFVGTNNGVVAYTLK